MPNTTQLFVNIDHVATIRNQRGTKYPNIITAADICEISGATGITVHLREDRRHINDEDLYGLKNNINSLLNMEMAATKEMVEIAKKVKPDMVCIVPEKREELTTEGGLNITDNQQKLSELISELNKNEISVSLFIEPNEEHISVAHNIKSNAIEIHTGAYANTTLYSKQFKQELSKIDNAIKFAKKLGIKCNAGHGLDYHNIIPILELESSKYISEFNIGHSIISRAVITGLSQATTDMLKIIKAY